MVYNLSKKLGLMMIALACLAAATSFIFKSNTRFENKLSGLGKQVGQVEPNPCPESLVNSFADVCMAVYEQKVASPQSGLSFKFEEELYKLTDTEFGEDPEIAKKRIQKMWNENKLCFKCKNFTNVSVADANLLNFGADTGNTPLIYRAVKKYELDVNFKDPASGDTVLDTVEKKLAHYVDTENVNLIAEYKRIQKILRDNGAKRSSEL